MTSERAPQDRGWVVPGDHCGKRDHRRSTDLDFLLKEINLETITIERTTENDLSHTVLSITSSQ
jgi:hypothetical protein